MFELGKLTPTAKKRRERLAEDTQLICYSVISEEKSFKTLTTGGNVVKLYFFVTDDCCN